MFFATEEAVLRMRETINSAFFRRGLDNFGIADTSLNLLSRNAEVFSIEPELSAKK